jgi:uncharacterized protein (DUF302 family)
MQCNAKIAIFILKIKFLTPLFSYGNILGGCPRILVKKFRNLCHFLKWHGHCNIEADNKKSLKKGVEMNKKHFLVGVVTGILTTVFSMMMIMPSLMINVYESNFDVDTTVAKLESSIKAAGWSVPGVMNMNKAMKKHGVEFSPKVRLLKLCKAKYAKEVLAEDRFVASLMPCSMAVYEGDDGKVYISKMNTGLMGKLFGGAIARVMGGSVAQDEINMLKNIVK